jgi:hypothetical protein
MLQYNKQTLLHLQEPCSLFAGNNDFCNSLAVLVMDVDDAGLHAGLTHVGQGEPCHPHIGPGGLLDGFGDSWNRGPLIKRADTLVRFGDSRSLE